MATEEWLAKIRAKVTSNGRNQFIGGLDYFEDVPPLLEQLDMRQLAIDEILEIQVELKEEVRELGKERDSLRLDLNIR